MNTFRSRLALSALAAVLVLGAAACSSDSSDSSGSSGSDTAAEAATDGADAGSATGEADDDRAFGVDDDGLATAMKSATRADRVEIDGDTFRLHFTDGSSDDPAAAINCSALAAVKGASDVVVLVYPDGELACDS